MSIDPTNVSATELASLLNSTAQGEVTAEHRVRRQIVRAGSRAGSKTRVKLLGYLAWQVATWHSRRDTPKGPKTYDRLKDAIRKRQAEIAALGRDVGRELRAFPPVFKRRRRQRCRSDFGAFCKTYLRGTFPLPWCDDHRTAIKKLERGVLEGGLSAHAMPRASGKTSLAEAACMWAILYGHRAFVSLIGATADRGRSILDSIKTEFECNELLLEDFRLELYPIWALERIHHRALGQTCNGVPTRISWTQDHLVMPTVKGSACSGSILSATGLEGGNIRGQRHKLADGTVVRPDFALLDDPQTTESAWSVSQSARREALLAGDVLGMAGPNKKIAAVCCCTVIRPGDMADNILDREKHPAWQGERTKLVYKFPDRTDLWERYETMRSEELKADGDGRRATAFYREHRKEMDAGAVVAWRQRKNHDEISAIQHAMNLLYRDRNAFYAEYQNEPIVSDDIVGVCLDGAQILKRCNELKRGEIPARCEHLTAFVDVHAELLYWVVLAWEAEFRGYLIDYGTHPEQRRGYFTLANATATLGRLYRGHGPEARIRAGLLALIESLASREFVRQDGVAMSLGKGLIDEGYQPDVVEQAIRSSGHGGIFAPSRGVGIRAGDKPMSEYHKNRGDVVGFHWRMPASKTGRAVRVVHMDVNFWKTFVHARLAQEIGDKGSLSLFGTKRLHRLLADHLSAEYAIQTEGRGRVVYNWSPRPGNPDNHWFDCVVGASSAASMLGVHLPGSGEPRKPRKRYTAADLRPKARSTA